MRPEAVASPNRGPGLAPRHPEEIVAGPLLALCAPSGRLGLAEPVEDPHDKGELLLEVRIELVGVAHGEKPLARLFMESRSARCVRDDGLTVTSVPVSLAMM